MVIRCESVRSNSLNLDSFIYNDCYMWLLSPILFHGYYQLSKDLTISVIDSSSHGLSWFITQSGLCNTKFLYVMIASVEIYACFGTLAYFNVSID